VYILLDCAFVHVRADESDLECAEYTKGFCKDGPYCRRKHQRREMCLDYLAGFCILGPQCEKAHPRWDTKKESSDVMPLDESKLKKGPVSISEITCHLCHLPGHFAAECPNASENERDREKARGRRNLTDVLCFRCGQKGHYANVCKNARVPPPPGVSIITMDFPLFRTHISHCELDAFYFCFFQSFYMRLFLYKALIN
jgi:cleavage and polyadenylation specificity factor subunit 4